MLKRRNNFATLNCFPRNDVFINAHKKSSTALIILSCIVAVFFSESGFAQTLHQGQWKTYTAMSSITDIAVVRSSGNIWVATTGGAFRFDPSDTAKADIFSLRNSDGLSDNDITAIAADSNRNIYLGGSAGTLDVYSEPSHTIKAIRDISLASYTQKQIYSIAIFGSRVYIATGFGLSIYDTTKNIFEETITKFGSLATQDTVFAVTEANDSIYVIQSAGIAIAPKNATNLSDPRAWHFIFAPPATTLNSVVSVQGKMIIGGRTGIYEINADTLQPIFTGDSISTLRLVANQNTLYVIDSRGGRIKSSTDLQNFSSSPLPGNISGQSISSFALTNAGEEVFGDNAGGGVTIKNSSGTVTLNIFPDGPLSNYITNLHFAGSLGKLFVSMGNIGLSVFDSKTSIWAGLSTKDNVLPFQSYTSTYYDTAHSKLWLSTDGGGLYSLAMANPSLIKHYGLNEGIPPFTPSDPGGFTVMGAGGLDKYGNFMVTSWSGEGKGLSILNKDGLTFTSMELNAPDNLSRPYGVVVQDDEDIYYVGTVDNIVPAPYGVLSLFPDGSTIPIPGGNGETLGSSSVNALIVDQDNGLWCGSNIGVDVLTHSTNFQTGKVQFNTPRRLTFTDQQLVKAIAVDGIGNKWVGTDNGVFILSPDGSDSLAHYTSTNSPLIDNSVLTIAIDAENGEAYIGTPKGISRVSSIYQQGATDYSKIFIYPNPVIQQSDDNIKVTISGLAGGSTVKIFSTSGRLIATIDGSQLGSTVTWNGRDDMGKLLTSGVYIAAAASPVTTQYGETKFVLIRK